MTNHFTPELRKIDVEAAALNFLGISVSVSRNDDTGQLTVMILTEDIRRYDTHEVPGTTGGVFPIINVMLNDGDIYDDNGYGDIIAKQRAIDAVETEKRRLSPEYKANAEYRESTEKRGNV